MNSQRPAALADMQNIMAVPDGGVHAGPDCAALPCKRGDPDTAPVPALAVATLDLIARLLTRALPALAVATLDLIARLLTRALPALAVATLGSAECLRFSRNPFSRR
jgi:hypothetical protein